MGVKLQYVDGPKKIIMKNVVFQKKKIQMIYTA